MIKRALRAEKARLLADKLGIIPHSESQWKWALRKLRPFVDKPKELAKAKERIGKLSNRERQLLQSAARKARLGQEVALVEGTKIVKGEPGTHRISGVSRILRAHTHPEMRQISKKDLARPSGVNLNYNSKLRAKLKARAKKFNMAIEKKYKGDPRKITEMKQKVFWFLDKNLIRRLPNYESLITKHYWHDMASLESTKAPQSILAPGIEGVHKYREKLPRAVRSVYFKGGL